MLRKKRCYPCEGPIRQRIQGTHTHFTEFHIHIIHYDSLKYSYKEGSNVTFRYKHTQYIHKQNNTILFHASLTKKTIYSPKRSIIFVFRMCDMFHFKRVKAIPRRFKTLRHRLKITQSFCQSFIILHITYNKTSGSNQGKMIHLTVHVSRSVSAPNSGLINDYSNVSASRDFTVRGNTVQIVTASDSASAKQVHHRDTTINSSRESF